MTISTLGCGQPAFSSGPFTPASISGLKAWYDAQNSGSITQAAGIVSQWNDLSSVANHVSQATVGVQPLYNATGINGHPSIDFTRAVTQFLGSSSIPFLQFTDFTVFAVINPTSIASYNTIYCLGNSGDEFDIVIASGTPAIYMSSASPAEGDANTSITTSTSYYIAFIRSTSLVTSFYINGVADTAAVSQSIAPISVSISFTGVGGDNAGEGFPGSIGEIIVYNRQLNSTEIGQVNSYLSARWGI